MAHSLRSRHFVDRDDHHFPPTEWDGNTRAASRGERKRRRGDDYTPVQTTAHERTPGFCHPLLSRHFHRHWGSSARVKAPLILGRLLHSVCAWQRWLLQTCVPPFATELGFLLTSLIERSLCKTQVSRLHLLASFRHFLSVVLTRYQARRTSGLASVCIGCFLMHRRQGS